MDSQLYREIIPHLDMPTEPDGQGRIWSYCPMHGDGKKHGKGPGTATNTRGRSLSLHPTTGLKCFGGNCTPSKDNEAFKRILTALGMKPGERPEPTSITKARPDTRGATAVATYEYRYPNGDLAAIKQRLEYPDPTSEKGYGKTFKWRRPDGDWRRGLHTADCKTPCTEAHMLAIPLWNAEKVAALPLEVPIWVTEGEKAAETLISHGEMAVTFGGGASSRAFGDAWQVLKGHPVRLWPDNDESGLAYMAVVRKELAGIARSVETVDVLNLGLANKEDAVDFFDSGRPMSEVPFVFAAPTPQFAKTTRLSDVEREDVKWLWPGYIPLGKLVALDGDPGLGKSTLSLDFAARVTTGRNMPDGAVSHVQQTSAVLLVSCEDGFGDTVRPRMEAANGDPSLCHIWPSIEEQRVAEFPLDTAELETVITRLSAKLVIIDPFSAHLGSRINSFSDQDMRRVLAPLAQVASRTGATIILVRHLNKAAGPSALYRGGGSIATIAAARAGLLVATDPDDPKEGRILAVSKMNLARPGPSQRFRLITTDDGTGRIEWLGSSAHSADALVAPRSADGTPSAGDDAGAFLRDILGDGPVPSTDVFKHGEAAGHSETTLQRAKRDLGIKSKKGATGWSWQLPPTK